MIDMQSKCFIAVGLESKKRLSADYAAQQSRSQTHVVFASALPPDVTNGCAFPFSAAFRSGCALALDFTILRSQDAGRRGRNYSVDFSWRRAKPRIKSNKT